MKYPATFVASCALILTACEHPLEPRSDVVRGRTRLASVGLAEHIAWRLCYVDWDYDTFRCVLTVANGDGTSVTYGDVVNEPSWSPDATRIAVDDGTDILVVTLADGSIAPLTSNAGNNHSAAWSPDGARIAFVSNRDGQPELYLMNAADGGAVTRVTNSVGFVGNPDWFPDGSRLAFECQVQSGNHDICAINADGTGFVRLTSDPAPDVNPAVSPDGARIAFATGRYGTWTDIAVMNSDGSSVMRLTTIGLAGQPAWSPGGTRMSFTTFFTGACNDYCEDSFSTMYADGSHVLSFAGGSQSAWRPGDETPPPPDDPPVAHASADCTNLTCGFRGYESTDDHQITHYVWNFGDGSPAIDNSGIEHVYAAPGTYVVTLTVFDGSGQSSTATVNVTVPNHPPVAQFTVSCTQLTCTFDSAASTDDDPITWHNWLFGDNSSAGNVVATSHAYAAAGTYQVTLLIADDAGRVSTATQNVTVAATPPDQPPVAVFTSSCVGRACTFSSDASSDDHGITSRGWSFGDGAAVANIVAPSHTYAVDGTYQVKLTVNDSKGQGTDVTHSVTVIDKPPVASFSYSCSNNGTCTFDGRGSSDDIGITSYTWKLGSQGAASGSVVSVQFKGKSSQTVTLTVKDGAGQASSVTQTIGLK